MKIITDYKTYKMVSEFLRHHFFRCDYWTAIYFIIEPDKAKRQKFKSVCGKGINMSEYDDEEMYSPKQGKIILVLYIISCSFGSFLGEALVITLLKVDIEKIPVVVIVIFSMIMAGLIMIGANSYRKKHKLF